FRAVPNMYQYSRFRLDLRILPPRKRSKNTLLERIMGNEYLINGMNHLSRRSMMTFAPLQTSPRSEGSPAADFTLTGIDGNVYSSHTQRQKGLLLAVLFKTGCGTCKYTAPYLQRFQEQYALPSGGKFQIWGISQDDPETTRAFASSFGNLTF